MEKERPATWSCGFTLLELLVTVAVAAVVVGVAVPQFSRFVAESRVSAATTELRMALHFARSAAVTGRLPVTLCKSADGAGMA